MSFKSNRRIRRISTYSKVVTVLSVVTIGFLLLFSALLYYNYRQERQFYKSSNEQLEREINSLLDLNSDSYLTLINEITYWDELVNFIEKKDVRWFNSSISYLVDTYRVDYIDAYNLDNEFITKVSTTKINSFNFIPKEIFAKLKKGKLIKFYVKVPEGIVQVFGATIHSSEDPFKNKTKSRGYFFMAKLLDSKYFSSIESVSSSRISYITDTKKLNAKELFYIKEIKDVDNKEIAKLIFKRPAKVDFSATRNLLLIMLGAFLCSIGIFLFYAKKWAQKPIRLIKEVLEKGHPSAIDALKNSRGEFRYIGKLFEQNNNQKIQLEKAKSKAEESDKLKSAFLMNLSHEIRTPMNAIMGFTDLLLNPNNSEIEKTEYTKNVQKSGKNLIDIIDDLVEISKIDSNLVKANYSSINLPEMLQNIFDVVNFIKDSNKNIDFKFIQPKKILKRNIITDAAKLNQIITNLLTNAVKFTKEGFVVLDYKVDEKTNWIHFSIKDSGKGIPMEHQGAIFTRFNRVDLVVDNENKGLGLGLAIAKSYVDMLGGTMSVKSQVGVGSTFSFSIPFIYDTENVDFSDKNSSERDSNDLGNEEIVLVAEDENINYMIIEKLLRLLNFKIIRAKNGAEAVKICRENKEIDLVLMDIKMPKLDGHETFKKIREFNKLIPIIAQTAYAFPEEIEKIKTTGFNDFISKPIDKDKLFELVKKYMSK
jgi:signal transduction histidine kinase